MTRILAALVRPTLYAFNPVTSTRAFSAKSGSRDHYQTLGVNQNATHAQIKSAFDEYTVVFNQEKKTGNPDVYKKYREIEAAYNILSDYESRRLYNKGFQFNVTAQLEKKAAEDENKLKAQKAQQVRTTDGPKISNRPYVIDQEWNVKNSAAISAADVYRHKQVAKEEADYTQDSGHSYRLGAAACVIVILVLGIGSYSLSDRSPKSKN